MIIDWNTIGPTAADWAAALELLVGEAVRLGPGDHAARDALIDQLTELIARSPAVAAELDRLAAKVIDDLLATEVRTRLGRLAMRSSELRKQVDFLRTAARSRTGAGGTGAGATGAGPAAVREQAHEAAAAVSKRLLPEVERVLERVRALRPKAGR
ncbi:MAG TPA: hypothetical protein VNM90_03085 [Haliangium sp.]|nr:hypothetical protein [Haliangium sp.]